MAVKISVQNFGNFCFVVGDRSEHLLDLPFSPDYGLSLPEFKVWWRVV